MKNLNKRIFSAALALCLVTGSAAALPKNVFSETAYAANYVNTDTSGKCGDNVSWSLSGGVLTISGSGAMYDTYYGYSSEKYSPFYGRSGIKSVVIKQGVTTIGKHMFEYCKSITSVSIPSSVIQIGEYAFAHCESLKKLTLPDSVTNMDVHAFDHCISLESVTISNGLTKLNGDVFGYCNSLKSVSILKNVSTIVWSAFEQCANLASISVAADNSSFSSVDGVLYDKDKTKVVICPPAKTSVTLPSSLKTIGYHSFGYCTKLAEIKIPESVTALEDLCFCHCEALKTLTIPKNVTVYDEGCTFRCDNLTAINFDKDNTKYTSVDGVVYNKAKTTLVCCPEGKANVTIPSSVTKIDDWAFNTNNKITSITIPSSVKSIGIQAFRDCENLKSISIPQSVTDIGRAAFYGCKSLESITFPEKLTKLSDFVLYGCENLKDFTIPKNVTTIEDCAFYRCTGLGTLYVPETVTTIKGDGVFAYSDITVVCKMGSEAARYAKENKRVDYIYDSVTRLAGKNRYETAAEISKASFDKAGTVVLAYGLNYADALAGVPYASKLGAPILLTATDSVPAATLDEIKRLGAKQVKILGGEGIISKNVESLLKANGVSSIERIAGKTRFSTAAAIADKVNESPTDVFFVYGLDYADALSVSTVASIKNAPIIYLTTSGELNTDTAAYLAQLKKKGCVKNAYVIGGTGVVSDDMMNKAAAAVGLEKAARIAGANRYATCTAVNDTFKSLLTGNQLCIATGMDFPDALSGGVYAAKNKSPLFLVNGKAAEPNLNSEQKTYLKSKKPSTAAVFGGTGVVPNKHVTDIVDNSI